MAARPSQLDVATGKNDLIQARERLNARMGVWGSATRWTIAPRLPNPPDLEPPQQGRETLAISRRLDLEALRQEIIVFGHYAHEIGPQHSVGPGVQFTVPLFDQEQAQVAKSAHWVRDEIGGVLSLLLVLRGREGWGSFSINIESFSDFPPPQPSSGVPGEGEIGFAGTVANPQPIPQPLRRCRDFKFLIACSAGMMDSTEYRPPRPPFVSPGGIEHFERDMTVTVAADVSFRALQQNLASVRQWLPIDGNPDQSVGELIEMNSTGPLRLGFGAWRDLLLGCQSINQRGELITAGGRAFKNVAGYDLTKLMVGQQGVLGKVVTMTTRTYQLPERAMIVNFTADTQLVNRLLPSVCRPQWMILNQAGLHAGYLGDDRTISFIDRAIIGFSPIDRKRIEPKDESVHRSALWDLAHDDARMSFRASVPPVRITEFIQRAMLNTWVADAAFGIVRGHCRSEEWKHVCESASAVGGRAWEWGRSARSSVSSLCPVVQRMVDSFRKSVDFAG